MAIGQGDGTAFAEVSAEGKLIYLGRLPQQSFFSLWREIRSHKNYVVIGSEAVGHGVQIFDWTKVRNNSCALFIQSLPSSLPIPFSPLLRALLLE